MSTVIDTLIYDRTQEDVDRVFTLKNKILRQGLSSLTAEEKAEYMAGMKGAYNHTDMNRVGQAVAYIADRMTAIPGELAAYRELKGVDYEPFFDVPYDPSTVVVSAKTDWAMGDIPTQSQVSVYLQNLSVLRSQLTLPADTPEVPATLNSLTFETANDIERLLFVIYATLTDQINAIYTMIDRTEMAFLYTGEIACG